MQKSNKNTAYSLYELAIVILIIGTLIVGVSQGYNLIYSSRVANARGLTAKSPISQIDGLIAWYESSLKESFLINQISNNSQITNWKDVSSLSLLANANILTCSASSAVTFSNSGPNKIPAILFNNGKISISELSSGNTSQATIFIVFKFSTSPSSTYQTLLDGASTNFSISVNNNSAQLNAGTVATTTSSTTLNNSKSYILVAYMNSSNSKIYINDNNSTFGATSTLNIGNNSLNGISLGKSNTNTLPFYGYLSEVVVFNKIIKAPERKEIFNYLSKKYNIEVNGI